MFFIYSIILTIGSIILLPRFIFDVLRNGKYAAGFRQRLGKLPPFAQNGKPVLWLHCVSVGETNAALPLAREILANFPEYRLVVSTTTKTGQKLAKNIFKDLAELVFYFPLDFRFAVRRALRHIQPKVVLIMETEIWFNFLRETYKTRAKIAIVNGRLSEKSLRGYLYIKSFMQRILHYIDLALMQGYADSMRLKQIGIRPNKTRVTGNIKFDQISDKTENILTEELRNRFGISKDSPLIVAASTHSPEEKWILDAFKQVYKTDLPNLPRLLIAPRHPERFAEVGELIEKTGFSWTKRTNTPNAEDKLADVILLDSIGELRAAYPLAEIVFVGGSLIPHGGQSILEPALAKKAIVTGFYTRNFAAIVQEFLKPHALVQLPELDKNEVVKNLAKVFENLLRKEMLRNKLGLNAYAVMQKNRGATKKTIEYLRPLLEDVK